MSAKPREEPGSDGRWFGEDFERIERVGSTVPRFDEPVDGQQSKSWEDETYEEKQFHHQSESSRKRPPVAMETASTDGPDSDLMRKSMGEGDLYTSLLSNQSYPFQQGFTKDTKSEAQDRVPSLGSHGLFGCDSGIEMTPGESIDFTRKLLESEKMEAYNYMDISHGEKPHAQPQQPGGALGSWGEVGGAGLGQYLEKSAAPVVETLGPALDEQAFPYVEDPSDEELSDYQPRPLQAKAATASPVKITLTETETPAPQRPPQVTVSDRDSILSLGLQGIPTVTLSEPEDDSPGSSTPPLTEESDSPSDPRVQESGAGTVSSAQGQVPASPSVPTQPSPPANMGVKSIPPKPSAAHDQDASSAESGDSEIELVSEEPPPRKQAPAATYTSPAPPAPVPPAAPAPSVQYSILREEREAELDSELIIESFDASSASEESPKRVQDSPTQKGQRPGSRLADTPSVPASRPTPSPPAAVAPAPPPASEKAPVSGHVGDDAVVKPKPSPTAVAPPEVRLEQPAPEERGGKKRRASEGRRDSARQAAVPAFTLGLDRQKGEPPSQKQGCDIF
ncbi:hypothetical protein AGOR_G00087790 [Albula goreensis]|uniref:Uncharacterized protein n=1 Tax=Albula goreensis TaxID=1534307 RepID=A0A8T3DSU7_9TELE|nr:hypothetical protein AGOR_G00087790 [Albula goreensis]